MLEVSVKTLDSQNYFFTCEEDITVRGFKEHIAETVSIPAESQRLIYCGRVLQDDKILNDYDVNGKVIHLVQRAPPQPESRTSNDDTQRQNNNYRWRQGVPRVHYQRHLHRNAMYLGTMSVPEEIIEGLPASQMNSSLSNSRLIAAKHMLNKAIQLMDRLDDPSVPLHPSPTENNASETPLQASAPEEEADQDSNVNSNVNNARNRMVQAASEIAAAFSAAALINIRLLHDNSEDGGSVTGSVNLIDASRPRQNVQNHVSEPEPELRREEMSESERSEPERSEPERSEPEKSEPERAQPEKSEPEKSEPEKSEPERAQPEKSEPERSEPEKSEPEKSEPERSEPERSEPENSEAERPNASTSNENQNTRRQSTLQVPRPPQMAELLERLVNTQDRLRPYIERYRVLMLADPSLTPGSGPEGVTENQRIVDGVSECLHYLSHACHSLSDIIVDMGQQPPRNLRCRPIIIQHSAILQAGIPIQVESHMNLSGRNATNNNNATDEGNEATRPSSPTSGASDQTTRSNNTNTNSRAMPQNVNGQQSQPSLLGTLLNLPSNVELSMELSPQSTMDLSSPSAADGSENEHGQSNNNNNSNAGGAGNMYSMAPPFVLIRDALRTVFSERHSLMDTSGGTSINTPTNIPFVTIVGQQTMDIGTPNSGQSTQARSNIGTHPTTSTQTRSTARPHVLHPHPTLNVGASMGQSLDFDPFLPCNSHHIRRTPQATSNSTSTSQSNQANQSTSLESHSRSQSASQSSASARNSSQGPSINLADLARELLENNGQAFLTGIGLPMTSDELSQVPTTDSAHISFVGRGPVTGDTHLTPQNDTSLFELLRLRNNMFEFTEQNFLNELWLFLLRNITFGGITQLSLGQSSPLINLRQPLREFLEHSFPNVSNATLQERVVEQIVSLNRPLLQILVQPEEETTNRRIDIPATIEPLLRKFCNEIFNLLFNNDVDNNIFAQEVVALAKKLEEQLFAVFQYLIQHGQIRFGTVSSRFIETMTRCIPMLFHQSLLRILTTRICDYTSRTSQMSETEITSLLVYKDESFAPAAESIITEPVVNNSQLKSESAEEPHMKLESTSDEHTKSAPRQQEQEVQNQPIQEQQRQQQELKQEVREEAMEIKSEPMETEVLEDKIVDDPMDLANGEEIPETFPGAENLPADWVPIIARDSVRQRRQVQMQALQGGPIPFSDAYLSGLPSKRRKLIEQQKPQLLVSPVPSGANAIAASLERLVREGIGHTQVGDADGAASAVSSAPGVRSAFGQAIKDCLHPDRLRTPDFPNAARFPNATKYFADGDKDKEDTTPTTTTKTSK